VGAGFLVLSACAHDNRRVFTQPARAPAEFLGGETEDEVRRAWGAPDRTATLVEEKTGNALRLWQYDRFVDANGSKVTTTVTFAEGKVARVEQLPVPRSATEPGTPRDSAARRDME
jgi:hypothetical protein